MSHEARMYGALKRRRAIHVAKAFAIGSITIAAINTSGCKRPAASDSGDDKKEEHASLVKTCISEVHSIESTVMAQGTIVAAQGAIVHVAAVTPGRIAEVLVREGDLIQPGQIVARIDNKPQQMQAVSAAAALTVSKTQANQTELSAEAVAADQDNSVRIARLNYEAALQDRDTGVELAQTSLQAAETDFDKTKAGARPQEIAQAVHTTAQALATRNRAQIELDRSRLLYDKGVVAKRQLEDAVTALDVAIAVLGSAQQQESLLRVGARAEDLKAAQLRVTFAQQTLKQARLTGDAKVAQAKAALRQADQAQLQVEAKKSEAQAARQTVTQKQADYASASELAKYSELRSSIGGIVTKRTLNSGDYADTTTPILEVTDNRALNLVGYLPADQGELVRTGFAARVRTADSPGTIFYGSVLSVGQVDPQTNLMSVRVALSAPKGKLRTGQFASVEIVTTVHPQAVSVPKQAIINRDGHSVVYQFGNDGVAHRIAITVASEQAGMVEVSTGLKAGTKLIILGQYELSEGAKVEEEKAEADKKEAGKGDAESAGKKK